MRHAWHRFVAGKDGHPVVYQRPNIPLVLWLVLAVSARFVHGNPWHAIIAAGSSLALVVWSVLEIGWGASYFRRVLGAVVLVGLIGARLLG